MTTTAPAAPAAPTVPPPSTAWSVTVGGMYQARSAHRPVVVTDWASFLAESHGDDTVVELPADHTAVVLDCDVHHWPTQPTDDHLDAVAAAIYPAPDLWFISHGRGLKGLYLGSQARVRASMAALAVPRDMQVELATHFRHPAARSSKHGATAGPVHDNPGISQHPVDIVRVGTIPAARVDAWLEEHGMRRGARLDHRHCPIAGHEPSDAGDCVTALDAGIYCHRCAGKQLTHPRSHKPGFVPYTDLIHGTATVLSELATERIHWGQAQRILAYHHPNLGEQALRSIYQVALEVCHAPDDPRLPGVFNDDLTVLYTTTGWVDATTFRSTDIDNDLADAMPMAQIIKPPKSQNGQPSIGVDRIRRSTIKSRVIPWMIPIRPYRGICLTDDATSVPVEIPPSLDHPISILAEPLPLDEAMQGLSVAFPGINRTYLLGCLAAMICAECGSGQPPAVVATGPSGSGKGVTIDIAASFLGSSSQKVQLLDAPDAFMRQIGSATTNGHRALIFDEMGKVRDLEQRMANLLQIGRAIDHRQLYQTSAISVPLRSALFFPCVRFPDAIRNSPEFLRRTRCVRLLTRTPNWAVTCGGDAAAWRHASAENAKIANSIVTAVYQLCVDAGFVFDGATTSVANRLDLGRLDDDNDPAEQEALRNLYRYATGMLGPVTTIADHSFVRGWVNIGSPGCVGSILLNAYLSPDDDQRMSEYRRTVEANLKAMDWNLILGIDEPAITIDIQCRSSCWGLRFRQNLSCKRGTEVLNDQLPPTEPPSGDNAAWLRQVIGINQLMRGNATAWVQPADRPVDEPVKPLMPPRSHLGSPGGPPMFATQHHPAVHLSRP